MFPLWLHTEEQTLACEGGLKGLEHLPCLPHEPKVTQFKKGDQRVCFNCRGSSSSRSPGKKERENTGTYQNSSKHLVER